MIFTIFGAILYIWKIRSVNSMSGSSVSINAASKLLLRSCCRPFLPVSAVTTWYPFFSSKRFNLLAYPWGKAHHVCKTLVLVNTYRCLSLHFLFLAIPCCTTSIPQHLICWEIEQSMHLLTVILSTFYFSNLFSLNLELLLPT